MKKLTLSLACFFLLTVVAFAQAHRDTGSGNSSGIDFLSVGIGIVIGVIIGYLIGSRARKV
ncbi:hypothetical protein EXU85_15070 [Spirosoma sp. KCTC 42546]|uniref:hypothetical protein n=1 Tax=Spirosoma sp. KCTC 42546 TaxID=2520506 RepID=UPI00115A482B|nr:hypothetical protein [Spirosoma sp. KCTC 42546]QDK79860.1 hypothetical protein EXU85_15070 [Spirosoma sp. KCTC 42546]